MSSAVLIVVLVNEWKWTQDIFIAYKLEWVYLVTQMYEQATLCVHQTFYDRHLKSHIAHMHNVKYSCIALSFVVDFMPMSDL
jgi:hypothetical protein